MDERPGSLHCATVDTGAFPCNQPRVIRNVSVTHPWRRLADRARCRQMILITAATGQVGRAATLGLLESGVPVRALVRDPDKARGLEGAELVRGSFEDGASLKRALDGVTTMLLAGRDSPEYVAQIERVIAAAERAHVGHIVALSAIGAAADSPIALMRDHCEIERRLRAGAGRWTFLRPHLYLQNLLRATEAVRLGGRLSAPMGRLEIPFVDTGDVGAAAASVLQSPDHHAGLTYALTGPARESYASVAAALTRLLGRPVAYEAISQEDYRDRLLAAGAPAWRAADLAFIADAYGPEDLAVTPDLPRLLGRPARSLSAFLDAHRDVFMGVAPHD
jgi:uncharacterized protein YbjT (DUF2867 family)